LGNSPLRADPEYDLSFTVQHLSFNLLSQGKITAQEALSSIRSSVELETLDYIAVSSYVWCDYLINDLIQGFRDDGFNGILVLGGYQIHPHIEDLKHYSGVDYFISGYAEDALKSILSVTTKNGNRNLYIEPDLDSLPSPYIDDTIPVRHNQPKVRVETKRGCPFNCRFCGHRDLRGGKVYYHPIDKVKLEIEHVLEKEPQKLNIIDPVFNYGDTYLSILEFCSKNLNTDTIISLQSSVNLIRGVEGERFLQYCADLNAVIEIGVESIHQAELSILNKNVNNDQLSIVIGKLRAMNINYESNLMYGLPNQTYSSFCQSIEWLQDHNCNRINCNPLMLLPGTWLHENASSWGLKSREMGPLRLPYVILGNTFNENDWEKMNSLAMDISPTHAINVT